MKLVRARIDGFGRLSGTVDFAEGMTVICGPNEAGKTTLVECILRLLYGYPEAQANARRTRFLPWHEGRAYRAALTYRLDDGSLLETTRDFGREDVPTTTAQRDTGRPIPEYSGSRKTSPGEGYIGLSMAAFEAAAVVRASDFANASNGKGYEILAERLAALVGSAGETSAAAAIGRLKDFLREIGGRPIAKNSLLTQAGEEWEKAHDALETYSAEHRDLSAVVETRRRIEGDVDRAQARMAELGHEARAARLDALRRQLARVRDAQACLAAAEQERAAIATPAPALVERADAIESAASDLAFAEKAEAEAKAQAHAQEDNRAQTRLAMQECGQTLAQGQSRIVEADAEHSALAERWADVAPLSAETVAQLNAQDEHIAQLDAQARRSDAAAAIARQKLRPSPGAAFGVIGLAAIVAAVGFFWYRAALLYPGLGALAFGVMMLVLWAAADARRRADLASRKRSAEEAAAVFGTAKAALESRCGALGFADVEAAEQAREAQARLAALQGEIDQLRAEAAHQCERHRTLETLYEQLQAFESRYRQSRERTETVRHTLCCLLAGALVEPGTLEAQLQTFRALRDAGRLTAAADLSVAQARGQLHACLGDRTPEDMIAEETALAGQVPEPDHDTGADRPRDVEAIQSEIEDVRRGLIEWSNQIERCNGQLQRFEQRHPEGSAALEERLAACATKRLRLSDARRAAELALTTVERVKDQVHGNFVPLLSAAIERAICDITDGRYVEASVDPENFTVRLRLPETGDRMSGAELSSGTREQIFLALRAATAAALGSGERVPLILDDALVHSDDARLAAGVHHLANLARGGQQIVLCTQRDAVVSAARRETGVQVVTLAGPR
ncbi:MAG: AAA family ATPase [Candidatus Eremiobacteraeota bacterium]|nr:AAA family ATPase [Candidatus Eremiobacteraeota bacterium]